MLLSVSVHSVLNTSTISVQTLRTILMYITFNISGPPAPPTNIQVTTISACTINIEWVWPQITTNDNMAPPDYAVFEVNFIGESRWMRIGVADVTQTSLMARIPGKGLNTNFHLRTRCTSNSRGPGDFYVSTDTFTIYSEGRERGGSYLSYTYFLLQLPCQECCHFLLKFFLLLPSKCHGLFQSKIVLI